MDVRLPDGTVVTNVPEGTTQADLLARLKAGGYDVSWATPTVKESTILGEAKRGARQFISGARTGVGAVIGSPEEAARAGLRRAEEIETEAGEGPSLERIGRIFRERGLLPAAGQVASDIPRFLAQQGPQIGATIAGAKLGAMAGSAFAPGPGTLIGAGLGAIGANVPSTLGSAVQRQAATQIEEGKPVDISMGRAAAATAGSAALEAAGTYGVLGKSLVKRVLGVGDDAALIAARKKEDLVKLAQSTIAGGVVRGAAVEMPVEVAQSVLDRWQAGLDVTSDDAFKEYGESMYAAGLVGGPIGGASAIPTRRAAQRALDESEPLAPGQRRGETLEQAANRLNAEVQGLTGQLQPPPPSPFLSDEQLASMAAQPDGYANLIKYEESIKDEPRSPEKVRARRTARELRARLEIEAQQRQAPPTQEYPFDPYAPAPFQFKSGTELVEMVGQIDDPKAKLTALLAYKDQVKAQPESAERTQNLKDVDALYNDVLKFAEERGFVLPKPDIMRATDLAAAGIKRTDPLYTQLRGKDFRNPDTAREIVKIAEDAQRRSDITSDLYDYLEGIIDNVEAYFEQFPGGKFVIERTYPKPSRTGVSVAGQPKPTVPTGGAEPSGRVGMVGPATTTAPTVPREEVPRTPVAPVAERKPSAPALPAIQEQIVPPVPSVEPAFEPGLEVGESERIQELEAEVRKLEAERSQVVKLNPGPNLFTAVKGKLARSDVLDIGTDRHFRVLTNAQGRGTFVSELVNNSQLNVWLPPDMRPESESYDNKKSEEYVKELLRNRDHIPEAVKEKLRELNLQISNIDEAIESEKQLEILIRQANQEFQVAAEERRAEEAELPATGREVGSVKRAEEPAGRAQIGKPEPFTIDVEARVIEETVGAQVARLPAPQVTVLENHYGEKTGTQAFLNKVKEDIVLFANKGASAVAEAVRSIIRTLHAGVLAAALIFNPINITKPEALVIIPKAEVKVAAPEEIKAEQKAQLATVPDNVQGMSDAAKQAYQTLIPSLKDKIGDKLIVIADKPSARVFVFTSDGNLVVQNKALFGAAKGDLYKGNVDVPSNRVTPAGLFGLKLVDARTGPSAKRTAGEYDFGKIFALEDPEAVITIMHSVWLKDSDAAMRQAALRSPEATDSRYSYGCINVDRETFKYLLDNHERQMDGAKMFVVPDNQAQLKDFLYGDIAKNVGGLKPGEGPDRLVREAVTRMSLARVAPQTRQSLKKIEGPVTEAKVKAEQKFLELEAQAKQPSKPAPAKEEPAEVKALKAERAGKISQLEGVLKQILTKYGLGNVKLNLEEGMQDEGSYSGQLIKLALDLDNPVRTLRHEAIHALKELGFFTPAQWKVLTDRAKSEWVDKYLKNQSAVVDGKEVTRYEAYMDLYKGDQDKIIEEAIADAFGDFSKTKPPPGMMQAILKRMENLFKGIKQAFNKNGYQTAEDVFGQIEEGKLSKAENLAQKVDAGASAKLSLRIMRGDDEPELEGKVTVNKVGKYFDDQIIDTFGRRLDYNNPEDFDRAVKIAFDEVKYQLQQNKSGLDWYEADVKQAFKDTIKIIPELKKEENRILFSVIAGIMSPQTNARDNWFIAANAYQHYTDTGNIPGLNPETGGLWQGGTTSANKKLQLEFLNKMIEALGQKAAVKWLLSDHTVKEINEFRSKYGNIKSGIDGKLNDVKPGLYAFGPKVGPFVSNLNGIHDVTVDLWMTRTFNRYFGTMVGPDDKIIDAPTEPQRRAIKQLINKVAENANIKPYQVQSVLWFYEQSLFSKLGTPSPSYGFSDGGRKFFESARRSREESIGATAREDGKRGVIAKPSLRAPDTKEFDTFFGASKIVDKDDEPKVMYHGTARDITSFVPKQAGAIFVTDDPDFAETFSRMSADWMAKHADQFLSPDQLQAGREAAIKQIKKDYRADPKFRDKLLAALDNPKSMYATDANEILAAQYKDQLPTGPNIMPVYVRAENPFDFDNPDHIRQIEQYEAEKRYTEASIRYLLGSVKYGSWEAIEDRRVQDAIKQLGFDGFYVKEGGNKNLAVYSSNQIKSAIGNQGTYDITNADIRKSLRTLPTLPTDVTDRIKQTVVPRERPGMVGRLLDAISPRVFSQFRAEFINRYDALANVDRQAAEQIRLMGGVQQLADAKAESAALFSDLGGGLTASAMGVHDRVGGIPVYVRKYIVEKNSQKIGPDYTTRAAAEAAAKKVGGEVFEQGYTTISNANGVKGLIAIFADLAKYKKPAENEPSVFDQYQFWADVKRASKYILNPGTGKYEEKLFTKDDIRRAAQIEKAFPEFVQIQKDWIQYNDGLVDFMRDTGVISEAGAKEMKKHGDYFPFYRHLGEDDIQGPRLFSSIANVKSVKAAKGSEAEVTDFFETIVRNTQSAIQSGIKNIAARRATDQALRIKEVFKLPHADSGPSVYRVLENGKETYYRAQDPYFIDALKALNQPDLPFIGFLAGPAKLLRTLVTKDPAFQLANMMRDSLSAYVSSGYKYTPIVATLKQYGSIIAGKSPEEKVLRRAGVIGGYDYSQGVEASAERLEKEMRKVAGAKTALEKIASPVTSLWGALEKSSEASDAATRNEVYKRVLAETGNEAEALYQALEIMNFNRKGRSPIIRILTAAVPFMNARIQGLDVLYRSGMRPIFGKDATEQEKARLKTFWVRGMTMMALSSMYWALTSDDEEYKKQEQEVRDNYWLLPSLGIKIPIPFEIGVMFKVIPERILEYSMGSDTGEDFRKAMGRHLMSTFGFNPIPQTLLPAFEVTVNRSFFTQRPIITQGMENISPEYQVGPNTSKIAGAIGQSLGISPIKLDYLIQGYTGTMGMYAVNLFDSIFSMNDEAPKPSRRLEQMPVLRRFMVDPEARGQITAYYDLKNSVDQVVRTSNYLERSMDFEQYGKYMQENIRMFAARDYINDLEKTLKEFREMKNLIRISQMDADSKRDSITNIGRLEQQLTQNIKTLKKQLAAQQ